MDKKIKKKTSKTQHLIFISMSLFLFNYSLCTVNAALTMIYSK